MKGLVLKLKPLGMKYVSTTRTIWRGKAAVGGCSRREGSAQPCWGSWAHANHKRSRANDNRTGSVSRTAVMLKGW